MKVGLVLSGGGAKGAYQAGMVAALSQAGVEVSLVSGASIGALNGAIIAAAPGISEAADRLSEVWTTVAQDSPFQFDHEYYARYVGMLAAAGLSGPGVVAYRLMAAVAADKISGKFGLMEEGGIFKDDKLVQILDEFLNVEVLDKRADLYVSLYPHKGGFESIVDALAGEVVGRFNTRESVFLKIQALPCDERKEALLASAAIPVLFKPRKVGGNLYSDGGQGNYRKVQGNTPITPMLGQGLDAIIVSHLTDGSLWDVGDFPDENILELRPREQISDSSLDMVGFDEGKILDWMEQGKRETYELLETVFRIANARGSMHDARERLEAELAKGMDNRSLDSAVEKLKEKQSDPK